MSTPLIILAVILAFFALVLIPFMMAKGGPQRHLDPQHNHGNKGKKPHKKKKKR